MTRTYAYPHEDNIIVGPRAIATYIKARSMKSFMNLVHNFDFPVGYHPQTGQMFSSMKSIDQWIFLVAAAVGENKGMERFHASREHRRANQHIYNERWRLKKEAAAKFANGSVEPDSE